MVEMPPNWFRLALYAAYPFVFLFLEPFWEFEIAALLGQYCLINLLLLFLLSVKDSLAQTMESYEIENLWSALAFAGVLAFVFALPSLLAIGGEAFVMPGYYRKLRVSLACWTVFCWGCAVFVWILFCWYSELYSGKLRPPRR